MCVGSERIPVRFREWGVRHFGRQHTSHRLRAQILRRQPLLRDHWFFSSRGPPATPGPRTCTTRRSVTTPLAKRSLLHCSLRSEKKQRTWEFRETIKNARKKLETSVAPAMPCKILKKCGSGGSNKTKTKLCILEADESTRLRMGNSAPNHHEDHIAGKSEDSLQHYNLVHKFIPMPQSMKIPAAKAMVDKEWENLEIFSAWNLTKVRSKKQVIDEARTSGATIHFASFMDMSFEKCWIGSKAPKIQRSSCTPRWHCRRRFRFLRSIHRTRTMSVQIFGFSSTTTQMALIMVQCGKPSRSSWAESVRSSFSRDCYGKGNLRRSYWSMVGRRFPIGNAFSYTVKRISLVCVCGRYQTGLGRHKTLIRMWKVVKKEVDLGEPTSFLDLFFFWVALRDHVK